MIADTDGEREISDFFGLARPFFKELRHALIPELKKPSVRPGDLLRIIPREKNVETKVWAQIRELWTC